MGRLGGSNPSTRHSACQPFKTGHFWNDRFAEWPDTGVLNLSLQPLRVIRNQYKLNYFNIHSLHTWDGDTTMTKPTIKRPYNYQYFYQPNGRYGSRFIRASGTVLAKSQRFAITLAKRKLKLMDTSYSPPKQYVSTIEVRFNSIPSVLVLHI